MSDKHLNAQLFELNNGTIRVLLTNYGATIISLFVPDKQGKLDDIVLGFDSVEEYTKGNAPYFGCIVGRVANRIKEGKFSLYGIDYSLAVNNGPNSLHGMVKSKYPFHNLGIEPNVEILSYGVSVSIRLIASMDCSSGGYPGDVTVTATYILISCKSMRLDMEAVTKSEFLPVKGTVFDFTSEKKVGSSISEVQGLGYDHNYVLDCGEDKTGLKHAAKVKDPSSSRVLNLWADAPGMQFYTANYVNGVSGKGGAVYERHSGLCFETQGFPNAINQPNFPSIIVHPGEKYKHTMLFEFSVE
ncbi:hypothetical protein GH714_032946 [Hevea brasiliensis]|uniref:Aldose 1-epimerase n=1 Tax=Hevea brasiliensis TaxID=3981 RepID=A0A6A6L5U2_HEVBR|nr:hypothetical protein GH714_032946 [Hevea brasiliensis]